MILEHHRTGGGRRKGVSRNRFRASPAPRPSTVLDTFSPAVPGRGTDYVGAPSSPDSVGGGVEPPILNRGPPPPRPPLSSLVSFSFPLAAPLASPAAAGS